MATPPVVLAGPPPDALHPRVVVARHRASVNAGDGRGDQFVVRDVVDGRTRSIIEASTPEAAVSRAAALVRASSPFAVWLVDETTATNYWPARAAWRPLARAAADVQAAYVAWVDAPTDAT
ncbi:MAG: hypothetical protein ABEH83_06900 [Halobacterium sp.]